MLCTIWYHLYKSHKAPYDHENDLNELKNNQKLCDEQASPSELMKKSLETETK